MLGATLVKKWQDKFDVFATDKENFPENPAKNFVAFDLLNKSYNTLMDWASPKVVVHCAAITNVDYCQEHLGQAMAVNAESVEKFLQLGTQARMIFISSDAVFPSGMHLASEKDRTAPENIYGKSKEVGEQTICNTGGPHIAIRTTIIGKNINPSYRGFVEWIVNSVKDGNEITLFDDALFTPITTWHLAYELEWVINNPISGIVHIGGNEPVTKYEFGRKICKVLGLDKSLIRKGSIHDINFKAKRSKDQTLDSGHYQRISGRNLPSMENTIAAIAEHFKEFTYA